MVKLIKVSWIGVIVLSLLLVAGNAMALTDEERLQILEDKFLNGEISEDIYRRLSDKYRKKLGVKETPAPAKPTTTKVQLSLKNIVQNASFEEPDPRDQTKPFWWGGTYWGKADVPRPVFLWDDKVAHSGKRSVFVEVKPGGSAGVWIHYLWKDKEPRFQPYFKPDTFYQMSAWVKAENTAAGSGIILDGCEVLGERPLAAIGGTHDWKKLVIKGARLKEGANVVYPALVCRGGKVWFDDVEIIEETEGGEK